MFMQSLVTHNSYIETLGSILRLKINVISAYD